MSGHIVGVLAREGPVHLSLPFLLRGFASKP